MATLGVERAKADYERLRQEVTSQREDTISNYLQAKRIFQLMQKDVDQLRQIKGLSQALFDAGRISEDKKIKSEIDLQQGEEQLLESSAAWQLAGWQVKGNVRPKQFIEEMTRKVNGRPQE